MQKVGVVDRHEKGQTFVRRLPFLFGYLLQNYPLTFIEY